jgi:hypothetical protein
LPYYGDGTNDGIDANQAKADADREHMQDMLTRMQKKKMDADKEERKQVVRAGQKHLKEEMKAQVASLVSRIQDINEKFEVLQGTLVSQMGRHQEKWDAWIADMKENRKETKKQRRPIQK